MICKDTSFFENEKARNGGVSSSELVVFEDEVVVFPVSSTKTGVSEDEMGIIWVSSSEMRVFEDEILRVDDIHLTVEIVSCFQQV